MYIHFIDLIIGAVFGQLLKLSVERNTGEVWFEFEVCVDMLVYLLTAIGLTPGGSSTVHIYTQNNTQSNTINLGRVLAVPLLCELYAGICFTT